MAQPWQDDELRCRDLVVQGFGDRQRGALIGVAVEQQGRNIDVGKHAAQVSFSERVRHGTGGDWPTVRHDFGQLMGGLGWNEVREDPRYRHWLEPTVGQQLRRPLREPHSSGHLVGGK